MECKECGTSVDKEAHDNYICYDCWCRLDLIVHEELQKKNSEEEQVMHSYLPTPSHLGEFVITAGLLTAGVFNVIRQDVILSYGPLSEMGGACTGAHCAQGPRMSNPPD